MGLSEWLDRPDWAARNQPTDWLRHQLARPTQRVEYPMPDLNLASIIQHRLRVPASADYWRGDAGEMPFVTGRVAGLPPYGLVLRAYLKGDQFGYFHPPGSNGSLFIPRLRGQIEPRSADSCALSYRVDGFWIPLVLFALAAVSAVIFITAAIILFGVHHTGSILPQLFLVGLGVVVALGSLSIWLKLGRAVSHEKYLLAWLTEVADPK
jgi:hypothetical protein